MAEVVDTARSYVALEGSVEVGGVLMGAAPTTSAPANYTALAWTVNGPLFTLTLIGADGAPLVTLGDFRGSMIQQAMAYAADGRVTATTMTTGGTLLGPLRIHLHPALVDTPLGCSITELDRFGDEASSDDINRALWSERVETQIELYNDAVELAASQQSAADWLGDDPSGEAFQPGDDTGLAKALALAFPSGWNPTDEQQSVFAHHPQRFSQGLVKQLISCAPQSAQGAQAYWSCVAEFSVDPNKFPKQHSMLWTGVREHPYTLAQADVSGTASAISRGVGTEPLRFMYQVAFEQGAESPDCGDPSCRPGAVRPWEFPVIGDLVQQSVETFATGNAGANAILGDARRFTLLQRIFRAALAGQLGPSFDKSRLLVLMRAARQADPVLSAPTPAWSNPRNTTGQQRLVVAQELAQFRTQLAARLISSKASAPGEERAPIASCAAYLQNGAVNGPAFRQGLNDACQLLPNFLLERLMRASASVDYLDAILSESGPNDFPTVGRCSLTTAAAH